MTWILLEGLDRSGKSSVADIYREKGFEVVHMNAPSKKYFQPGYAGASYLEEIVDMYTIYAGKDVLWDRTIYGECIWPEVYNRQAMLGLEDLEYLQKLEYNNNAVRYVMYDENTEAHWKRCVDNKEPLNRLQFVQAGRLYDELAIKYNFEKKQLSDFEASEGTDRDAGQDAETGPVANNVDSVGDVRSDSAERTAKLKVGTSERSLEEKLERANAIRDLLGTAIVRKKGQVFKKLDEEIKVFLEQELEDIFTEPKKDDFTQEEVQVLKIYAQRIREKLG